LTNREVAELLRLIADLLEIKGEVVYKSLAYRRAAASVEALPQDISEIWQAGSLRQIPGVGAALEKKLDELLATGQLGYLRELQEQVPVGVVGLLGIPGVGPKTARLLWEQLGAVSVDDVARAAREGKLRALPGLGERSEQAILAGVHSVLHRSTRISLGTAWPIANGLVLAMRQALNESSVEAVGSLRRGRETIGDIDMLVACGNPAEATAVFVALSDVAQVVSHGPTRATVMLKNGLQADLRALKVEHYGSALQYFTGSKEHNVALRKLAQQRGLSLSKYGFREGDRDILCPQEQDVYAVLGLPWIPPELREDRGEITAAQQGLLPDLVESSDLRGDLHVHTDWSDGVSSVQDVALAARQLGYEYLAITDHSSGLGVGNGLDAERLRMQRAEIDRINELLDGITILQGVEVEIRADGSLDHPDEILQQLDLVVASLHLGMRQDTETITRRLLKAMESPHVDIIGHPSGRLIGQRDASNVDLERVLDMAAQTGTALEVNASPNRLDLDDVRIRRAVELGVQLCINSDAHSTSMLGAIGFGVVTARRGWAESSSILNTLPLHKLREWLSGRSPLVS